MMENNNQSIQHHRGREFHFPGRGPEGRGDFHLAQPVPDNHLRIFITPIDRRCGNMVNGTPDGTYGVHAFIFLDEKFEKRAARPGVWFFNLNNPFQPFELSHAYDIGPLVHCNVECKVQKKARLMVFRLTGKPGNILNGLLYS